MRLLLSIALAGLFSAAAVAGGCPKIRYEPRQSISILEFRQLGQLEKVPGSAAFYVAWFDYEDYPNKDGWSAFALVMAANGDLGETPVAGVLWANMPLATENHFEVKVLAASSLTGRPTGDGIEFRAIEVRQGCNPAALKITQFNNAVFANGKQVGKIED